MMNHESHNPSVFPHGVSCPSCREALICNHCGGPALKTTRCVNGRCPSCCSRYCNHYGPGAGQTWPRPRNGTI